MRPHLVTIVLLVAACRGPAGATATDGASTTTTTTSTTGDTGSTTDACERSSDCDTEGSAGGICVAGYAMADTLGGDRTPSTCVDASLCIQALDLSRWCFDHQGCCEGLRCRAADGICEDPNLGQDTTGTTTSGTDTATSSSGTDTSGTSSSGTDTSGTSSTSG